MELDVGVPSSSELKILQRLNWSWGLTWINIGGRVDLRPERASLGVEAWHIGIDPFAAFFLSMIRNFAENADLLVSVGVASGLWLIRVSPRVGISPVAAGPSAVAPEVPVLTSGDLIGGFWWSIVDGVDGIFGIVVDGKNMRRRFGLLSGERLDGCQFDLIV